MHLKIICREQNKALMRTLSLISTTGCISVLCTIPKYFLLLFFPHSRHFFFMAGELLSFVLLFLLPPSLFCFHQLSVGQMVLMEDRRRDFKPASDSICFYSVNIVQQAPYTKSIHCASLLFLNLALFHGLFPQLKISESLNFFSLPFDLQPLLLFLHFMILQPNKAGNIRHLVL